MGTPGSLSLQPRFLELKLLSAGPPQATSLSGGIHFSPGVASPHFSAEALLLASGEPGEILKPPNPLTQLPRWKPCAPSLSAQLFAYLGFTEKQGRLAGGTSGWPKPPFSSVVSSHGIIVDVAPDHFRVKTLSLPNHSHFYTFRTMPVRKAVISTSEKNVEETEVGVTDPTLFLPKAMNRWW